MFFSISVISDTEQVNVEVTICICIQVLSGLNLDWDTGCSEVFDGFPYLIKVNSRITPRWHSQHPLVSKSIAIHYWYNSILRMLRHRRLCKMTIETLHSTRLAYYILPNLIIIIIIIIIIIYLKHHT